MGKDTLRSCIFRPYRKGTGPVFGLTIWDTGRMRGPGHCALGYRLTRNGRAIFEAEDFGSSPMHAIDSDDTVAALMSFLTLRPGDTDAEYFTDYTPAQMDFCEQHAEALRCCVADRFDRLMRLMQSALDWRFGKRRPKRTSKCLNIGAWIDQDT
jgi:hypothetical protein